MKYLEKEEGGIFFIPLFLPTGIKENIKQYRSFQFAEDQMYGYGRLIEKNDSTGDLIEIFNYTGKIPASKEVVIASGRRGDPLHTTLAFDRRRWRFIFGAGDYDKAVDSNYPQIKFLLGTENSYELWKGGKKRKVDNSEARSHSAWTILHPTRVEDAIRTNSVDRLKG